MTGDAPVARAVDLVKEFGGQPAVDGLTLDIPTGAIVGLIGPSGCGKTTLVRLLTGILRPTSGEVSVFGGNPATFGTRSRRRFGYMPQIPVLFPNLSLWGNLQFISSVYGMSMRGRRKALHQLLDLVDLDADRGKLLSQCSGGMQRRLSLAATLVHDPELLYLDEPTAGIDPILRERFWQHFRDLRDQGRTIVVPTQYVGEAAACDLVAVMSMGRLLTLSPPDELAQFAYGGMPLEVELHQGWLAGSEVQRLRQQPFVRDVQREDDGLVVVVDDDHGVERGAQEIHRFLEESDVQVGDIRPMQPSLDDLFVRIIDADRTAQEVSA